MLLFIHSIEESKSFWLPQIRGLLSLGSKYSDQEIINMFAISLPGHSFKDKSYDVEYVYDKINDFIGDKAELQANLADELIQTHSPEIIKVLREGKLTTIGHSLGGALAYYYATFQPYNVARIITIDTPNEFNKAFLNIIGVKYKILSLLPIKYLINKAQKTKNRKKSFVYSNLAENRAQLGAKSSLDIMKKFNFTETFDKLSQDTQIQVAIIPILSINSEINTLSSLKKVKQIRQALENIKTSVKNDASMVNMKKLPSDNFKLSIEKGCSSNPHQKDIISFSYTIKKFLRSNLRI